MWTGLILILLATFNACNIISRFTRLAGELFGMLITVLFMQEAVKVINKFSLTSHNYFSNIYRWLTLRNALCIARVSLMNLEFPNLKIRTWKHTNTIGSMQMDCFLLFSPLAFFTLPLKAEEQGHGSMDQVFGKCFLNWYFFIYVLVFFGPFAYLLLSLDDHNIGWLRGFIADYGVPCMVLVWTALSYGVPRNLPDRVPRRLTSPLAWGSASSDHWTVIKVLNVMV